MLSFEAYTAKLFDVLGFLSPFITQLKIFFKKLCFEQCSWDDPLSGVAYGKWKRLILELCYLNGLQIPRCYFHLCQNVSTSQLHGFCDVSNSTFATVVYICSLYFDGSVDIRPITSKM